MHFSRVFSVQPNGLLGHVIEIETDISRGLHSFSIVGLTSKAIDEAKDRISSAIKNSGFTSPKSENHKIVIALAPAELRKDGAYFDVAMAIGYLLSSRAIVPTIDTNTTVFLGELALNGEIKPITGALALVQAAKQHGFVSVIVPAANAQEAALVEGISVFAAANLGEVVGHVTGKQALPLVISKFVQSALGDSQAVSVDGVVASDASSDSIPDFSLVKGQVLAKRALEIAAAGGHHIVLYGPPGTGKTTLARALIGILPPLSHADALEVTGIHSIAGVLGDRPIVTVPPFRSPHHTVSMSALIGGGSRIRPGEITLAHKGVLFLDEFPEFHRDVIDALRQPIEDRHVTIVRAQGKSVFPTQCMLVAAMNPPNARADKTERDRYRKKISGPIVDRIDLWVPVEHVPHEQLMSEHDAETSDTIRKRVTAARAFARLRLTTLGSESETNAGMRLRDMQTLSLSKSVQQLMTTSAERLQLSPRSVHRVIRVARTIADLESSEPILEQHILEALQYRKSLPWE